MILFVLASATLFEIHPIFFVHKTPDHLSLLFILFFSWSGTDLYDQIIDAFIRSDVIYASVYDDKIVCCSYVAKGQGGIVFVWDTSLEKIIHYSYGAFAIQAAIHNDLVYVLRAVTYWGVKPHLELDYCKLGTKSCETDPTPIPLPEEIANNLADDYNDYEICFDNHDQPTIIKSK